MTHEFLAAAIDGAAAALERNRRPWIVGVAHLVDVPLDTAAFDESSIRSILDLATSTTDFPSGPVNFIPAGYTSQLSPEYRVITLGGDSKPHLQLQIGLGIAGFVAVGLTRGQTFDDGSIHPGGIVLTDVESVISDTYVVAIGAALELGYMGPIDFAFAIVDDPQAQVGLSFYAIDDASGALAVLDGAATTFEILIDGTVFSEETTPQSAHGDILRMATAAAARFGTTPQLIEHLFEDNSDYYTCDPLAAEARGLRPTAAPTEAAAPIAEATQRSA